MHKVESEKFKEEEHVLLQNDINLFDSIESIVNEAIKEADEKQTVNFSESKNIEKIKEHTKFEKEMRKEEAFKLDDMKNGVPQNVISVNENQKNSI